METLKQFIEILTGKIKKSISEGDVYKANEIESNMMVGSVICVMMILSLLCLGLNEVNVFTVDKTIMRLTILIELLIETPIMLINYHYHGEAKWLRATLMWGMIAACEVLSTTLGHNVTLVMVIPVVLSIRYCDAGFTGKVAAFTAILFTISVFGNAYIGIINLNFYNPEVGTVIDVTTNKFRNSISFDNFDNMAYALNLLKNEYLPRLLTYYVIATSCSMIAKRGKEMTDTQDKVSKKTARLETELNLATEIQASMLPCVFPAFPEHAEIELFALNQPAKEVGGDFYDYFLIDDNHVAIVMADVSGKGVGAALFMTIAKITLKNQLMTCKSPAVALMNANRQLCENNDAELFVTVWAGIYEVSTMTLTYSNAGHNPPVIHKHDNECEFLKSKKGFVLAGLPQSKYVDNTVVLEPGDEIFLYTDGVTECNNPKDELYGEQRFIDSLSKKLKLPVDEQIYEMFNDLYDYMDGVDQFDDITMLAMHIKDMKNNKD